MMRRLHVTFIVKPNIKWWRGRADIKRIGSASRIWDKVHEAELAGVEVKFTVQVLDNSEDGADLVSLRLLPGFIPAKYANKHTKATTIVIVETCFNFTPRTGFGSTGATAAGTATPFPNCASEFLRRRFAGLTMDLERDMVLLPD